ncbi:MAG: efflux RND transporter periplasmic adaptor subunit [Tepidisphaeraceae bacterium]
MKLLLLVALSMTLTLGARASDPPGHVHDEHVDEVRLSEAAIREHKVEVAEARLAPLVPTFVAPARIAFNAEAMAHVGAPVRGRAVQIRVRAGDTVKAGDELIVVESPELGQAQSDYLQKRTVVEVALATVDPARMASERARTLYEKNEGIALAELQKREAELKSAQGAHRSAVAAMTAAENTLHLMGMDQVAVETLARTGEIHPRYSIRAPLDGQVIEREVTLGELVSPEREALLVLADMKTLWVLADVPEGRLADVAVGARAVVEVSAAKNQSHDGVVSMISPAIDSETRSARVRIDVSNGSTPLRPGMFARVWITTVPKDPTPVVAIPEQAVQTIEGESAIFVPVEGEENTFIKRSVRIGAPVGGMVPVLSGLKQGDKLVVSGSFILKAELGKNEADHGH